MHHLMYSHYRRHIPIYLLSSKLSVMNVLSSFLITNSISLASAGDVFGINFMYAPSGPIGGTLN